MNKAVHLTWNGWNIKTNFFYTVSFCNCLSEHIRSVQLHEFIQCIKVCSGFDTKLTSDKLGNSVSTALTTIRCLCTEGLQSRMLHI